MPKFDIIGGCSSWRKFIKQLKLCALRSNLLNTPTERNCSYHASLDHRSDVSFPQHCRLYQVFYRIYPSSFLQYGLYWSESQCWQGTAVQGGGRSGLPVSTGVSWTAPKWEICRTKKSMNIQREAEVSGRETRAPQRVVRMSVEHDDVLHPLPLRKNGHLISWTYPW